VASQPARLRLGVDVERLARGQATTRAELTVQMLDPIIRELVALFVEVNVIEDPDTRATVWATKADAIVEVYAFRFPENARRALSIG